MSQLKGKVILIVNTASQCGFTPQFEGLEATYQKYKDQGLAVIGFPCNQFGSQDPDSNENITSFCQVNCKSPPLAVKMELTLSRRCLVPSHEQDRGQWRQCGPSLPILERKKIWTLGIESNQMEL